MIPAIVEQYLERLNSKSLSLSERENVRFVVQSIRDACEKALAKYDGRRG